MSAISQKEYLKRYLSLGDEKEKRKKRRKKVKETKDRVKIIDDDNDLPKFVQEEDLKEFLTAEDAPQVCGIIDERPLSMRVEDYRKSDKWKLVGSDDELKENEKKSENDENNLIKKEKIELKFRHDSDSEVPKSRKGSDQSPQISTKYLNFDVKKSKKDFYSDENQSRKTKRVDSDVNSLKSRKDLNSNPQRRERKYSDDDSNLRRFKQNSDVDLSPRKRSRNDSDSDVSLPRKSTNSRSRRLSRNISDSDDNLPRRSKQESYSNIRSSKSRRNSDCDPSPRRRSRKDSDSDVSLPRKSKQDNYDEENQLKQRKSMDLNVNSSRTRKSSDYDPSPRRRLRKDSESDVSLPRKAKQDSYYEENQFRQRNSLRSRKDSDSDSNFRKRSRNNSDFEEQQYRQIRNDSRKSRKHSNSDTSPPRKFKNDYNERIPSKDLKRDDLKTNLEKNKRNSEKKSRWDSVSEKKKSRRSSLSPRNIPKKMTKTLDGRTAGIQSSKELKEETAAFKQREEELFRNMSNDISGKDAAPIIRDRKTGKKRDFQKETEEELKKQEADKEKKEKYDKWGKGIKQVEDLNEKIRQDLYEMSKPLARYADDEDLERYLKEQERDGDPMLQYIRKKKRKKAQDFGIPVDTRPQYEGDFLPNRYGIPPGHRWDGVDRSNGYEKEWFKVQNEKKAVKEEVYKWSIEDM